MNGFDCIFDWMADFIDCSRLCPILIHSIRTFYEQQTVPELGVHLLSNFWHKNRCFFSVLMDENIVAESVFHCRLILPIIHPSYSSSSSSYSSFFMCLHFEMNFQWDKVRWRAQRRIMLNSMAGKM